MLSLFAVLIGTAQAAEPVTWSGIDYGLVRMIGTEDFREPASIFPGYLDKWNDLFEIERMGDLSRRLKTRTPVATETVRTLHLETDAETQIIRDNSIGTQPLLTRADVVGRIATRYPAVDGGMALVLIADQLNKPARRGCFWVTFYDQSSLAVHDTRYTCGSAGGIGFRNYWFGTVKSTVEQLRQHHVPSPDQVIELSEEEVAAAGQPPEALTAALERSAAYKEQQASRAAQRAADVAAEAAKRNWITIRVAPEGLATLSNAGIGYDVLGAGTTPAVRVQVGASTSSSEAWPEAECRTAFGKTACGYDCTVAFGDVKCARHPGGRCEVAFGKITCSQ